MSTVSFRIPIKDVPVGVANAKHELFLMPKSMLALKYHNILTYNDLDRGGHFLALQEPQLLANDVWEFVGKAETEKEAAGNSKEEL